MRVVPVVMCLLVSPLVAQDASRHCKPVEPEARLAEGRYEGRFELAMVCRQDVGGAPMKQTFKAVGTFRIAIDRRPRGEDSPEGRAPSDHSSVEGELATTTAMDMGLPSGSADQNLKGKGSLVLKDKVRDMSFTLTSAHTTSGQIAVSGMGHRFGQDQSIRDQVVVELIADNSDCNGAGGKVKSPSMEDMAASMQEAGFQVEMVPCRWSMRRIEDASDKVQALREELIRKAPSGIHRTREAEAQRLAKIADRIRQEPKEIQDCLFTIWMAHVQGVYTSWVQEDAPKLRAYRGDWPGLQALVRRALEADRGLSLLGLDTCSESAHRELWNALGLAFSHYLKRMCKGEVSHVHLLDAIKAADLLGSISPQLYQAAWESLQREAVNLADIAYAAFTAQMKQARGRGLNRSEAMKDPVVAEAFNKAILTEKSASAVGVNLNRVVAWMGL